MLNLVKLSTPQYLILRMVLHASRWSRVITSSRPQLQFSFTNDECTPLKLSLFCLNVFASLFTFVDYVPS